MLDRPATGEGRREVSLKSGISVGSPACGQDPEVGRTLPETAARRRPESKLKCVWRWKRPDGRRLCKALNGWQGLLFKQMNEINSSFGGCGSLDSQSVCDTENEESASTLALMGLKN